MTQEDAQWLVGGEAVDWLATIAQSDAPLHALTATLRRDLSAERARLLLEQSELRRRAAAKFPHAARMFFTSVGLEQATDAWTATHKANRFHATMRVADLCCGIGGDLLAVGQRGARVIGVDRCPATLALAEANAAAVGVGSATFLADDAEAAPLAECDAWHADPDRRPAGRRTTRAELHSPDPAALDRMRTQNPSAAIKLAPAAEFPEAWAHQSELEWISRGGECKQLVAWFGTLTNRPGERTAAALAPDGSLVGQMSSQPTPPAEVNDTIGATIYEPDAAVFAAGLDGALAARHGLCRLSTEGGYLTGPGGINEPLLAAFAVDEVLPLRVKTLAKWLRERGIGRLEIKSRGVKLNIPQLRKQLHLAGDNQLTLLATRKGKSELAILARRVPGSP